MTSLPEVIKAPPRPAASAPPSPVRTGNDEARDSDFADLLDEAAGREEPDEPPSRSEGSKGRPKAPRPDSTAKATVTDSAEPVMPWLTAPLPPTPPEGGHPALAPGLAEAAATEATPDGGAAAPPVTTPGAPAAPPANLADALAQGTADKAGTAQATAAATPQGQPPAGLPADTATATTGTAAAATDPSADAQPMAATVPATAAIPVATSQTGLPAAQRSADAPTPATDGNADPRRAGRINGRAGGRAAADAGKPDPSAIAQQAAAGPAARGGQQSPAGTPTPELPTTPAPSSGSAEPSGFDALPALHGQAATQYAAAAASGRAATAHSPAMAQLAAPLVRVAEAGGGEFHIDLAPAELGRVRVVAEVSNGQVTLAVQAENADTLALLRRDLQQLEKALGESGLKLDNANLQFSLQGDGQSRGFAAFDQGGNGGGSQGPWRGGPAAADALVADTLPERAPRPIDGLVDVTI